MSHRIYQKLTSGAQSGYCVENFAIKENGVLSVGEVSGYEGLLSDINDIPNLGYLWGMSGSSGILSGSGYSGYIPRWEGSTILGISHLYDDGDNIGLDTLTPTAKFSQKTTEEFETPTAEFESYGPTYNIIDHNNDTTFEIRSSPSSYNNTLVGLNAGLHNYTGAANTIFGANAFYENISGDANTAIGSNALKNNQSGGQNTAIGWQSLFYANTTGLTAVGSRSLFSNTGGQYNTAVGTKSLFSNTIGENNSALGYYSLYSVVSGMDNTAVGSYALYSNTTDGNTAFGSYALYSNVSEGDNTAVGDHALYSNTAPNNTALGSFSLYSNVEGIDNTAVGSYALYSGATEYSVDNTAVGSYALYSTVDASCCTAVGSMALFDSIAEYNTAVGAYALYVHAAPDWGENVSVGDWSSSSLLEGTQNTVVGSSAFGSLAGDENVAVGYAALQSWLATSISYNTAIGAWALTSNLVDENVAVGYSALSSNTEGIENTAVGTDSLYNNTGGVESIYVYDGGDTWVDVQYGSWNTALGYQSLYSGVSGVANTAIGDKALYNNLGGWTHEEELGTYWYCTGSYNTAVGHQSLYSNTEGYDNSAFGALTLYSNTTGHHNVAIGGGQILSIPYTEPPACPALYSNTTGYNNVGVGNGALYSNITGYGNTADGAYALFSNIRGKGNTATGGTLGATQLDIYGDWNTFQDLPSPYNHVYCSAEFLGKLYFGVGTGSSTPYGARIYVWDGTTFSLSKDIGAAQSRCYGITALCVHNGKLYADARYHQYGDGYLWVTENGTDWSIAWDHTSSTYYGGNPHLYSDGTYLYFNANRASTMLSYLWKSLDGITWTAVGTLTGQYNSLGYQSICKLGDAIYIGGRPSWGGLPCKIYKYDGSSLTSVFDGPTPDDFWCSYYWNGKAWFGTEHGRIYTSADGVNWDLAYYFGDVELQYFFEYGGKLLLAQDDLIYETTDGVIWTLFYNSPVTNIYTIYIFNEEFYLGTGNAGQILKYEVTTVESSYHYSPLYSNTIGSLNVATGTGALYTNNTGYYNTALGAFALFSSETSYYNTAVGAYSLFNNLTSPNTAVGYKSLYSNLTGYNNTALGHLSLYYNTTGYKNTATGTNSLLSNSSGYNNTANGYGTLYNNLDGYCNTAIGDESLYANVSGWENTAVGCHALYQSSGYSNTAIGVNAGRSLTTGSENTFLGPAAGYHDEQKVDAENSIALGYNSFSWQDNQAVLGNSGTSETILYGHLGIATEAPDPCAAVDLGATDGGLLINRLDTTARDALTPVNGLIIYNITDQQFQQYANGVWIPVLSYLSTGIFSFDGLSKNTSDPSVNDKFDVGAIEGWIVDNTTDPSAPVVQYIVYPGSLDDTPGGIEITNILTHPVTYVGIQGDSTADIVQQTTPFTEAQQRDIIKLGVIVHSDNASVVTTNNQTVSMYDAIPQFNDLAGALRKFNIPIRPMGNHFSAIGGLEVARSAGKIFSLGSNYQTDPKNPHVKSIAAESPVTFRYRLQDSTEYGNTTDVDPDYYDDAGVKTAVPLFKFTVQRACIFESGLSRWQYGQKIYDNIDDAEAQIPETVDEFIVEDNLDANGILCSFVIVRQGCTDLTDPLQCKIVPAGRWGYARETIPGQTHRTEIVNNLSTGLRHGGALSGWAGTDSFSVEAGCGLIIDNSTDPHNPTFTEVLWDGYSGVVDDLGTVTGNPATHIFIDETGAVVQKSFIIDPPTPEYKREHIYLGLLGHSIHTSVTSIFNTPITFVSPMNNLEDLASAIGLFSLSGNIVNYGTEAMELSKTSGYAYMFGSNFQSNPDSPSRIETIAVDGQYTPASLLIYSHGTGFINPSTFVIDAAQYDPAGAGILSALGPNKWQIARIWHMASPNFLVYQYGQTEYANYNDAIAAVGTETSFVNTPSLEGIAYLSSLLLVRGGAADLSNPADAKFIPVGKFGGGGGAGGAGESGYSGYGESGWSGYSGYSGYGESGYSGYSGYGESGYSGYSGYGESGYSGYSGIAGAYDASGFSGYSGPSGWSGYSSDSGWSGYSGESGYSGYGESGWSGYSGYGESGWSGYSGESGWSGYSSDSGWSGYSGPSGWSGYSSDSGWSGYSGESGYSGYGESGYSGYSGGGGGITFDDLKKYF